MTGYANVVNFVFHFERYSILAFEAACYLDGLSQYFSRLSKWAFASSPPAKPVSFPDDPMTRWQGHDY
jgi:hypothetical protein